MNTVLPSVLWHCRFGVVKCIRPVKKYEWWFAGLVICLQHAANDCMLSSWCRCYPIISCFTKIQIGLTLPRLSWKRGRWMGVCVSCLSVVNTECCFVYRTQVSLVLWRSWGLVGVWWTDECRDREIPPASLWHCSCCIWAAHSWLHVCHWSRKQGPVSAGISGQTTTD